MKENLSILYQDDTIVAIDKPARMMVHRSPINQREKQVAMTILRDQLQKRVFPVHRLDRATSGVLLFALDKETARSLAVSFENRTVRKTYLALVRGRMEEPGIIDQPLKERLDRIADKNRRGTKPGRSAITEFQPLASTELVAQVGRYPTSRYSLVVLHPKTGRRHQLRRHLHHISHPIIGDTTYGDGRHNRFFRERFQCFDLMLSAVELSLPHPQTGKIITINSSPGSGLQKLITEFEWHDRIPERWQENPHGTSI